MAFKSCYFRACVNCHIKCDWQWFWPNYVRLSFPQYLRLGEKFRKPAYWYPLQVGYARPVGEAVYAIDDFPDDDLLWRIEWIGGVGYNTSVPSDPLMDVCMAQLPADETNPLSARSRSSQTKRTVRIGVGLLPYISIASVWRRRRPVLMNLAASRHWLCFDTSSCRILPLADLATFSTWERVRWALSIWPTVLLAAKTYGSVFYDKLTPSIAERKWRSHSESTSR